MPRVWWSAPRSAGRSAPCWVGHSGWSPERSPARQRQAPPKRTDWPRAAALKLSEKKLHQPRPNERDPLRERRSRRQGGGRLVPGRRVRLPFAEPPNGPRRRKRSAKPERFSWAAAGCAADSCEGRGVRSARIEMKYVSDEQRRPAQEDQANGRWPTESFRLSQIDSVGGRRRLRPARRCDEWLEFVHQTRETFQRDLLGGVTPGGGWIGVNFNEQGIGPHGDRAFADRGDEV